MIANTVLIKNDLAIRRIHDTICAEFDIFFPFITFSLYSELNKVIADIYQKPAARSEAYLFFHYASLTFRNLSFASENA